MICPRRVAKKFVLPLAHEHRTRGMLNNPFRGAPEQNPLHAGVSVR